MKEDKGKILKTQKEMTSNQIKKVVKTQFNGQSWAMVKLGGVCTLEYGKPLEKQDRNGGTYPECT